MTVHTPHEGTLTEGPAPKGRRLVGEGEERPAKIKERRPQRPKIRDLDRGAKHPSDIERKSDAIDVDPRDPDLFKDRDRRFKVIGNPIRQAKNHLALAGGPEKFRGRIEEGFGEGRTAIKVRAR